MEAAVYPGDLSAQTAWNASRLQRHRVFARSQSHLRAQTVEAMGAITSTAEANGGDDGDDNDGDSPDNNDTVSSDTLYLAGMFYLKMASPVAKRGRRQRAPSRSIGAGGDEKLDPRWCRRAEALFLRAMQRRDTPPHPIALYMLGWVLEAGDREDIAGAERYYGHALQVQPMDPWMFLRLRKLTHGTLAYVQGCTVAAERRESEVRQEVWRMEGRGQRPFVSSDRRRRQQLKQQRRESQQNYSGTAGREVAHTDADPVVEASEAAEKLRQRLLLHQRVVKVADLQFSKMEAGLRNLNTPGKFVFVEPFWLERFLYAFSECDDWTHLLRCSKLMREGSE